MKKILLFSALAVVLAVPVAQADESVRTAQAVLKNAGYYTGAVDGELNADTKGALRRYQLRNQLEPTGELSAETAAALNKEGAPGSTPEPSPTPSAPPVPQAVPVASPISQTAPIVQPPSAASQEQAPPAAVPGIPLSETSAYSKIFARTPYENAAPEIQVKTLREAQMILAEQGLLQGPADGRPGPATEEALLRLQTARDLPRTGRLDIDTLAELHLLPVSKVLHSRGEPYVPTPPSRPRGAVRGVPVD